MEEVIISPYFLAALFFVVALAYSSVGLGGGSSYTALMAIFGVNFLAIPTVSLTLNLVVTTVGSYNYIRNRHARMGLIVPFFITSIPMSYIGGSLHVQKEIFYWLLLLSLVVAVLRIYVWENVSVTLPLQKKGRICLALCCGAILGLFAGVVGIGGGIYLVPLIIILGLGSAKEAAASGAIFIWVNSLAGIIARSQFNRIDMVDFMPLIITVFLGACLGSFLGASKFSARTMQKVLGGIIIVAIGLLGRKILIG